MRKVGTILVMAAVAAWGMTASAQKTTPVHSGKGGSPHVKTEWTIDGAHIAIEYGRPALKGRSEAEMMPLGAPWRTGADEATTITSDKPLKFGSLSLPAGTYTINTEPGATSWQLIIGKLGKPGQWGSPVQRDARDRTFADVARQGEGAGRTAHDLDRRHAGGRHAARRVGHRQRDGAVHRGLTRPVRRSAKREGGTRFPRPLPYPGSGRFLFSAHPHPAPPRRPAPARHRPRSSNCSSGLGSAGQEATSRQIAHAPSISAPYFA